MFSISCGGDPAIAYGGDHGEVPLHSGFVDELSVVLALAQRGEHIFQRHRSELIEADAADHGIHHLQHPPVRSDGAGGVFRLPVQPAGREFLKGHFAVLGVAGLEAALQFFGGVDDILPDAALGDTRRNLNGLRLADFLPLGR